MRHHRFFVGQDLSEVLKGNPAVFDFDPEFGEGDAIINHQKEVIRQWKKVFRYEAGAEVVLFDGNIEVLAKIVELSKKDEKAKLVLGEMKTPVDNSKSKIYLALSILKGEHTDMVVEKATELGVSGIILVLTDRVVKKGVNLDRLQKIAIEASEQCGRIDVPEITTCESLETLLDSKDYDKKVVLDMGGEKLSNITGEKILLFIGPEGGWSDDERNMFKSKTVTLASIGENVLRAETAAIVGVSVLSRY
jgi:16S rRNA (uracil1498-N3)-methyltransferase